MYGNREDRSSAAAHHGGIRRDAGHDIAAGAGGATLGRRTIPGGAAARPTVRRRISRLQRPRCVSSVRSPALLLTLWSVADDPGTPGIAPHWIHLTLTSAAIPKAS